MNSDNTSVLKSFFLLWIAGYVFFYIFPFPFRYLGFNIFAAPYIGAIESLNFFIGKNLLGHESLVYEQGGRGSGDTTFDYVFLITRLLLALVMAFVLILSRKRFKWVKFSYPTMIVYARYFVGITLIQYGVVKFMIGQFPSPSISSMEQTFGEFSPMGLAWRFFGYSDLYKIFMGVSEISAGVLLLFRRTVVVGAMLSIAVVTNIVLVNFSFDVPVKLFSSHLLFFSILIFLPYAKSLFDILILRRPGILELNRLTFSSNKIKWTYRVVKFFMVVFIPVSLMIGHYFGQSYRKFDNPWEGKYEVISFEKNKPDFPSDAEWVKVILDGKSMVVERVSGRKTYFTIGEIKEEGILSLTNSTDMEGDSTLQVVENNEDYILIARIGEHQFDIAAKRKKKMDYFLTSRGFNWVNEYPLNK
ncbi:hypothetical protein [Lunatibacter salilacus]|uniref:hypothetical protein n=1 Tax=Lunatibacter salilacus TaxID=2483804 RepID=UPI00131D3EC3|nr:hypothetical protein [Lunatibacter salilacus]